VLVTIDTLRADRVGCYGAGPGHTPALDALAAAGARFETAVSPAPLTLPSHTTLLTGLDPPAHGVRHNGVFRLGEGVTTLAERFRGEGFATAAFVSAFVLERRFGLARGFDVYDDRLSAAKLSRGATAVPERSAGETVDTALAWLATAPPRFFLWVHLYDPHADYAPPAEFAARFRGRPYEGEVAYADAELGRLLAAVDARFPAEGTAVAATSDHGESLGEHGEATHAYGVYDATQRVPLILRGPGVEAGRVAPGPARLADVASTLLALAGAGPLEGAGASLLPVLAGREAAPSSAYVETLATQLDMGWSPLLGLRTATHKYVRAPRPELYDVRADPGETRDLAAAAPELAAELDRELEGRLSGAAPVTPAGALGPEERARLASLGYVVPESGLSRPDLGRVGGADPKERVGELAQVVRANTLVAEGRGREALAALEGLDEVGPDIELIRGAAAISAGELGAARASAERVLAAGLAAPTAHQMLGRIAEREGKLEEARAAYAEALRRDPENGPAKTGLGRVAEAEGDRAAARALYEEASGARVPTAEALWRLAALELEEGRRSEAERLLAGTPFREQRTPEAAVRLARAERLAGRGDLALLRVRGSRQEFSHVAALASLEGTLLEEDGRLADALTAREEALALEPASPAAANDVAWTLLGLGQDLERAAALAEAALAGAPGEPSVLDTLAAVRLRRGESRAALAAAELGLAAGGGASRPALLLRRAEALARLGRRAEAERALAEAVATPAEGRSASFEREAARVRSLL
jgi:choline-sulfatase